LDKKKVTVIYELNLPQPTAQLEQALRKFAATIKTDPDDKPWLEASQEQEVNGVDAAFVRAETLEPLVREQYGQFFPDTDIMALVGIMRNLESHPACLPPHVDQTRALAINYYIDLGGDHVTTSFYDRVEQVSVDRAYNFRYKDLNKVGEFCFAANKWYAFSTDRGHSVEGIETQRLMFAIIRTNNTETYTADDLVTKNTHIMATPVFNLGNKY
jgi:hypothetical protein